MDQSKKTKRQSYINIPKLSEYFEATVLDTGWRCVICYKIAQCWCVDVCLCVKHAEEYDFGYGKSLVLMKDEYAKKATKDN